MKKFNNTKDLVSWIDSLKRYIESPTLKRMNFFNDLYGNPIEKLSFIHITGTNGKGSILSALKSILVEKGINVGAFISPHVTIFNERISVNNTFISDDDLLNISNLIIDKYPIIMNTCEPPTYFELITLIAFIYFKRMNVDIVLLEAGIGVANDPTNIVKPIISIIGQVDYDHCEILGNTIEEIASDKAEIIKKNCHTVCLSDERINNIFINKAMKMNSKIYFVEKKDICLIESNVYNTIFSYENHKFKCNLLGEYQIFNMSIVIKTIDILNKFYLYSISIEMIQKGLLKIKYFGRMQVLNFHPLVILDGAHNPNGIRNLIYFVNNIKDNRKVNYIISITVGKDVLQILNMICSNCNSLYLTVYDELKSIKIEKMIEIINDNSLIDLKNIHVINSLDYFRDMQFDSNEIYIFCGSLYFARKILNE